MTTHSSGSTSSISGDPVDAPVTVGSARLTLEAVLAVALRGHPVALSGDPEFRARVEASRAFLNELLRDGVEVYGVNTGYGGSSGG